MQSRIDTMREYQSLAEAHYAYAPIPNGTLELSVPEYGWDICVYYNNKFVDAIHHKSLVSWIDGFSLGVVTATN